MTMREGSEPQHGNAYNIFILVLTIFSLIIMGLLILPLDVDTLDLLRVYDNIICVVFLIDFSLNLMQARSKREYFFRQRGWLDLLGSIPSLGILRFTVLFRLARLSRLARIMRLLGGQKRKELIEDVVKNRGQYALFITVLSAMIVMTVSSVMVLQFESRSDGNIQTGGDALWWALVTITTVGYGDYFPITALGRLTGAMVMLAGVGIIGALASILASLLVPSAEETAAAQKSHAPADNSEAMARELAEIKHELALLRRTLAEGGRPTSG